MKDFFSNPKVQAFLWRVWNTFKSIMALPMLLVLYDALSASETGLGVLTDKGLWNSVIYAGVFALIGSIIAGFDKVKRMS